MHAVGVEEFADCDGVFGVDAALVDPFLDFVEVDGYEVGRPATFISILSHQVERKKKRKEKGRDELVGKSPFTMHDTFRRLTTIEVIRHFSVLLLTFVTSSRCFTLSRGGTTTSSNSLVVCSRGIGERAQDRGIASLLLMELRSEQGEERRASGRIQRRDGELRYPRRQGWESASHGRCL